MSIWLFIVIFILVNLPQREHLFVLYIKIPKFVFQDYIMPANVHHVQRDTTVSSVEGQVKQGNVKKVISVSKVQSVSSKKYVLLENTVQLVPMFPSPAQLEPFLILLACGKKNNVQTVLLGRTALSKEEPTPLDHAEKVTFVLLVPLLIMPSHALLVYIAPLVSMIQV